MTIDMNRQWRLASRPKGMVEESNFTWGEERVPALTEDGHFAFEGLIKAAIHLGHAAAATHFPKLITVANDDGKLDFLADSTNATWFRQVESRDGRIILHDMGPLFSRDTSGHSPSSTVVDWNGDGRPELLLGGEDGHLYHGRPD